MTFIIIIIESNYDTTYEYVESPKPSGKSKTSVKYDTTLENTSTDPPPTHSDSDEGKAYHDVGPNATSPPELPARVIVGAQVHEQSKKSENVYHCAEAQAADDELISHKNQLTVTTSNSSVVSILIVSPSDRSLTLSTFVNEGC